MKQKEIGKTAQKLQVLFMKFVNTYGGERGIILIEGEIQIAFTYPP